MQTETASKPRHSVFENCRDLIGADLYRRNAFRVLGMSIDASVQSATKSQKRREMDRSWVGRRKAPARAAVCFRSPPPPTARSYEERSRHCRIP